VRVLVTGATGFIGGAAVRRLLADGDAVVASTRRGDVAFPASVAVANIGALGHDTDWRPALGAVDAIVHAAARVHVLRDTAADPLAEFRRANVEGTVALARQAIAAGVKRFIFISTIKVNGESTDGRAAYRASDPAAAVDPYGVSKHEAEEALRRLAAGSNLELVIIRPVLVYGPGVKGNFRTMLRGLRAGVPLPLASIRNRRSLMAVENLVDLIAVCLRHPEAAGRTFLASDDEDLSTPQLFARVSVLLGRRPRLFPLPMPALRALGRAVGADDVMQRLCGSLQVDVSETRQILGWQPPRRPNDALADMVRHYLQSGAAHG
jgi:UDP-glucose 4-epimerase